MKLYDNAINYPFDTTTKILKWKAVMCLIQIKFLKSKLYLQTTEIIVIMTVLQKVL